MNPINPPAIVRPNCSEQRTLAQRAAKFRAMQRQHLVRRLENDISQGEELCLAKEQCITEGVSWLSWTADVGLSTRTADRKIRAWNNRTRLVDDQDTCLSQGEDKALIFLAGEDPPEPQSPSPQTHTPQPGYVPPAGAPGSLKFCDYCRKHSPRKNCKDCDTKRNPPREPGDDTDSEAAAAAKAKEEAKKNGQAAFSWKAFEDPFGQTMRAIDEFGNAYKCKQAEPLEAARQHLGEALESMKLARKTFGKAK